MAKSKRERKEITAGMIARWRMLGILDRDRLSRATAKGHKHIVGISKLLKSGKITPAEYRSKAKRRKRILKAKKKQQRSNK
jgi:hypothetical protein